jgi:hypothetical protein
MSKVGFHALCLLLYYYSWCCFGIIYRFQCPLGDMAAVRVFLHDYITQSCQVHPLIFCAVADIWPEVFHVPFDAAEPELIYHACILACISATFLEHEERVWRSVRALHCICLVITPLQYHQIWPRFLQKTKSPLTTFDEGLVRVSTVQFVCFLSYLL